GIALDARGTRVAEGPARPGVMNNTRVPRTIFWASLLMLVASVPGIVERVLAGQLATQTPEAMPWGLWVAAYTFFSGISAGAFAVVALPYVFGYRRFRPLAPFALLVAMVSLAAALLYVMADLGRPERSWHIVLTPNFKSTMAWVVALYMVYGSTLVGLIVLALRPGWQKRADDTGSRVARLLSLGYDGSEKSEQRNERVLSIASCVGLVLSLGLAGGVGALISAIGGRGLWHSGLFPITFTVSALLSGISFVLGGASLLGVGGQAFKQTLVLLGRMIGYLLIGQIFILTAEGLIIINGGIPSHLNIVRAIAAGPYPWVFWGMQVGLGIVAALLLLFLPKRPTLAGTSVAALFVLIGVCAFRLNFVIPELAMAEFAMSEGHAQVYVPRAVEWELVVFGVGLVGLMLVAGRKYLPVFEADTAREFDKAARAQQVASELELQGT
ncbi:MAG: NrfD/PsrC family molybdoenzyme membrane anchor subunit, partial [Deltaproteobacteria bacterium]